MGIWYVDGIFVRVFCAQIDNNVYNIIIVMCCYIQNGLFQYHFKII